MKSRLFLSVFVLFFAVTGEAFSEPRRVLLLHSFGRDFAPWNEYARTFREELSRQSPEPIDLYEASLATARFPDQEERPFVEYLRALFAEHRLDLVVAIGSPAVGFVQRHRQDLFPSTPAVYTGVERRRVSYAELTANDAVVAINNDFSAVAENILHVLPARRVYLVQRTVIRRNAQAGSDAPAAFGYFLCSVVGRCGWRTARSG